MSVAAAVHQQTGLTFSRHPCSASPAAPCTRSNRRCQALQPSGIRHFQVPRVVPAAALPGHGAHQHPQRCGPSPRAHPGSTPRSSGRAHAYQPAAGGPAAQYGPGPSPRERPAPPTASEAANLEQKRVTRSLWTIIDVLSLLGSVAGALAALLGWLSPTYALALPLVLPVVSLVAALQREDLSKQESAVVLSRLSSSLSQDTTGLLSDARNAVEEVRRELASQAGAAGRLTALEGRLASAEAAAGAAAVAAREAAAGVAALRGGLLQELRGGQEAVGSSLRGDLARGLAALSAEEAGAAARLDARLAAVEGCLSGLEASQVEGLRRLSATLTSNLVDAEALLQSSIRAEMSLALEPVRRLPQMLATLLPPAPPPPTSLPHPTNTPLDLENGISASTLDAAGAPLVTGDLSQQQQQQLAAMLRQLVLEVGAALAPVLAQQAELSTRLSSPPRPAPLAQEQWEALGRRLGRLEQLMEEGSSTTATAVAGQLAPLLSSQQAAVLDVLEAGRQEAAAAAGAATERQQQWQEQLLQQLHDLQRVASTAEAAEGQQEPQQQQQQYGVLLEELLMGLQGLGQQQAAALSRLEQVEMAQQQLSASTGAAAEASANTAAQLSQQLATLQQQLGATGAALQQLQLELPLALASLQQTAAAEGGGATAAESPATAQAALAMEQVARFLQQLDSNTAGLVQQVAELSSAVQQQMAAAEAAAAAQQQAELALAVAGALQQEMQEGAAALRQQLSEEAAGWQQQLASASTAAVAEATGSALVAALQQLVDSGQLTAMLMSALAQQQQQVASVPAAEPGYEPGLSAAAGEVWDPQWAAEPGYEPGEQPGVGLGPTSTSSPQGGEVGAAASSLLAEQMAATQWQQQQQQGAFMQQPVAPAAEPTPWTDQAGPLPPPAEQQQQQQQLPVLPDLDTLPRDQLFPTGLTWLRQGREAVRGTGPWAGSGRQLAAGEVLLQGAVAAFRRALALTPGDPRLLGNLGNALLAAGELKRAAWQEAAAAVAAAVGAGGSGSAADAAALRSEAVSLLTAAGEQFRGVLEVEGWSSRALVNWGKAMTGRAELARDSSAAAKLYSAAITKFEAVLEEEPGNLVAKYRCGLALAGLAGLTPAGRRAAELWGDAVNYLGDVANPRGGAEPALAAAAAEALRPAEAALQLAGPT